MKIEKVNENQICCTLTKEDLEDRQIRLSELAYGSEKARMLFHDMIQQANYEFGFEVNDIPLMVEAIPMSGESIVLLITKVEYPEELDTRFSKFSDADEEDDMQSMEPEALLPAQGADDILDLFRRFNKNTEQSASPEERTSGMDASSEENVETVPVKQTVIPDIAKMFEFQRMDQVERFAQVLGGYYEGQNSLYKNEKDNCYELVICKSSHTPEEFNKVCNIASEYGRAKNYSAAIHAYYKEHGKAILLNNALQVLFHLGN